MLNFLLNQFKSLILTKSFFLGVFICLGIFSKYIFGNDNLLEQITELVIKKETGLYIDLSEPSEEVFEEDVEEIIDYYQSEGL